MARPTTEHGLGRRLLWFALLWCAGVLTVGAVAFVLRLPIRLLG